MQASHHSYCQVRVYYWWRGIVASPLIVLPRRAWGGAPRGVGALTDLGWSVLGDCLSVARVFGLPVIAVCGACCYFCGPLLIGGSWCSTC